MNATTPNPLSRLITSSVIYMILALIAAGIAIAENLPAEFGGSSTGLPVLQGFLYGYGTAMSPPLYTLLVQAVFTLLVRRRSRWGTIGIVGLAISGLFTAFGALSEPINLRIFNPATFDFLKAIVQGGMIIVPAVMTVFAILEWSRRRRNT